MRFLRQRPEVEGVGRGVNGETHELQATLQAEERGVMPLVAGGQARDKGGDLKGQAYAFIGSKSDICPVSKYRQVPLAKLRPSLKFNMVRAQFLSRTGRRGWVAAL